jgi:hypothetical protein
MTASPQPDEHQLEMATSDAERHYCPFIANDFAGGGLACCVPCLPVLPLLLPLKASCAAHTSWKDPEAAVPHRLMAVSVMQGQGQHEATCSASSLLWLECDVSFTACMLFDVHS